MGTNYYVDGVTDMDGDPLHIGKQSFGWTFCFQAQEIDDHILHDVEAWKCFLDERTIVDEYGQIIDNKAFFLLVDRHSKDGNAHSYDGWQSQGSDFHRGEFC